MIEGTLVRLRPGGMADLERTHRWLNDREVTRFLGSRRYLMALEAEENWMREHTRELLSYRRAAFAIETKDGRHIGNTNLFDVSPEDRSAELGIMIGEPDCWSQGFGADAIITLCRFGFEEMNLHRIELSVYGRNERGRACYRKVGFIDEACMRQDVYRFGEYDDLWVMSTLRDEFYAKHGRPAAMSEGGAR
jgi:RimJ/RimL family protein N-acetyltransferase